MDEQPFDVTSEPTSPEGGSRPASSRHFLGVHFACCAVYCRVYINNDASAYRGHCPRCGQGVQIKIGPGGTSERFFTAY